MLKVICSLSLTKDKATNPSNRQEDWEYIIGFCDQINKELEGWVSQTTLGLSNYHSQFKIYHLIIKPPCFLLCIYIDIARKIWLQKKRDAVKCGFSSVKGSAAYTQTEHWDGKMEILNLPVTSVSAAARFSSNQTQSVCQSVKWGYNS